MNLFINLIQFFVIFITNYLEAKLNFAENHTCLVPETYQQNILVGRDVKKPKTEISFCWDPIRFFRCIKTTYVTERIYENKPVTRTRLLAKCCPGYIKSSLDNSSCIPFCWPLCHNGNCTAPDKCSCFPGYHGATCLQQCPSNRWGNYCSEECQCMNEAACDFVTGHCLCKSGWRGSRCELLCEDGYYGIDCQKKCNCFAQLCNPQTGTCIPTTTDIVDSTNFKSTENSNFEIFEEPTISIVTTTKENFLIENDFLLNSQKDTIEEKTTAVDSFEERVTFHENLSKKKEKSNTVSDDDVKKFFKAEIAETQSKEIHLETPPTTEVVKAEKTTKTFSIKETTYTLKILKNEESDKTYNNRSNFIESENKENESKFINKTKKNYKNEINENGFIENATPGEYVTPFSKEMENHGNANKNYVSEGERNLYAFQFMPSLMVLFVFLMAILFIGARWLILKHRKRKHKIAKVKEDKFSNNGNLKFTENVYTVNNFFDEPINMSDLNLNTKEPPPVLLTFKPMDT